MSPFQPFTVTAPASTANLGPGFDSIGMALNRYLHLHFTPSKTLQVKARGQGSEALPKDGKNLILEVMQKAFTEQGQEMPTFHLLIENDIPLARGLGSSASAIVAALAAANHLMGEPWNLAELLYHATCWEDHPDNVGASLYGGVTIGSWDGQAVQMTTAKAPDLPILVAIPEQPLFTKQARGVLPDSYPRSEAVLASSRANLLTAALLQERWDLLAPAMQDLFHHPYRQHLVPGLKRALTEAQEHGAYGIALSGAGPTLLAFVRDEERLKRYFADLFTKLEVPVTILSLKPEPNGVQVQLTGEREYSTFDGKALGV